MCALPAGRTSRRTPRAGRPRGRRRSRRSQRDESRAGPLQALADGVLDVPGRFVDDLGDVLAALVFDPDADVGQQVGDHPEDAAGLVAVVVEGLEDSGLVLVVGGVAERVLAQGVQAELDGGDGGGGYDDFFGSRLSRSSGGVGLGVE